MPTLPEGSWEAQRCMGGELSSYFELVAFFETCVNEVIECWCFWGELWVQEQSSSNGWQWRQLCAEARVNPLDLLLFPFLSLLKQECPSYFSAGWWKLLVSLAQLWSMSQKCTCSGQECFLKQFANGKVWKCEPQKCKKYIYLDWTEDRALVGRLENKRHRFAQETQLTKTPKGVHDFRQGIKKHENMWKHIESIKLINKSSNYHLKRFEKNQGKAKALPNQKKASMSELRPWASKLPAAKSKAGDCWRYVGGSKLLVIISPNRVPHIFWFFTFFQNYFIFLICWLDPLSLVRLRRFLVYRSGSDGTPTLRSTSAPWKMFVNVNVLVLRCCSLILHASKCKQLSTLYTMLEVRTTSSHFWLGWRNRDGLAGMEMASGLVFPCFTL